MARFRLIPREEKFYDDFIALADQLVNGAAQLEQMVASDTPDLEAARAIQQIEHGCDTIAVIKWKEVLDYLEEATDRCEDVANVLEGVVVKHG